MTFGILTFAILILTAIATTGITVVAGVGGGLLLFAVLASLIDFVLLIPVHGAVQVSSSAARLWLFRKDAEYRALGAFLLTFIPCAAISAVAWTYLVTLEDWQPVMRMVLAGYLLLVLNFGSFRIKPAGRARLMASAGAAGGLASMIIGVSPPVMAPFFIAMELPKRAFIATWAFGQLLFHAPKLLLFVLVWDKLTLGLGLLIVFMSLGALCGAVIGGRIVGKISETLFKRLFYILLTIVACKLFFWDGLRLLLLQFFGSAF